MNRLTSTGGALLLLAGLSGCGGEQAEQPQQAPANNMAQVPEPLPTPADLAADAELANQAAHGEAVDAEIGGNETGAEPNMQ